MAVCARSCFVILRRNWSQLKNISHLSSRLVHKTSLVYEDAKSDKLVVRPIFSHVDESDRNKDTFLEAVRIYTTRPGPRRGHVEFIHSALKFMDEFGVNRDLQSYKNLLDILPKGQYIPTNMFQAEMFHYPKQQDCALDLLQKMEENGLFICCKLYIVQQTHGFILIQVCVLIQKWNLWCSTYLASMVDQQRS